MYSGVTGTGRIGFGEIHAIPIGSDQLHSVDPSWPDKGENSDLGLTHKSSLRGPRHVLQGPRSRVKGRNSDLRGCQEAQDMDLPLMWIV
ncbi:hypothetical protein TELCIR_13081 [Teladorsagia circumcincta]|uniref:Uncharacterized protein n=1 Tax=Teladorsagia circumcincta TaxID=45464 RepID=A0A2G9U543_TELCI|nr:hypothetical protein TELCIR_13081 [Teladorsagia circumcincta]